MSKPPLCCLSAPKKKQSKGIENEERRKKEFVDVGASFQLRRDSFQEVSRTREHRVIIGLYYRKKEAAAPKHDELEPNLSTWQR